MNFMGTVEAQENHVELKYCERCGGLWLRPQKTEGVYCASCTLRFTKPILESLPTRKARRSARPGGFGAGKAAIRNAARIDCLQGVATLEVRA